MKKGFISMTVVYSFLLIFIFTLLAFLVLYTQKSRLVDSIVNESKEQIYNTDYSAINTSIERINSNLDNVRYIKDCTKGSSYDDINYWGEIQVMKDGQNIALNKPVTSVGPGGGTLQNGSYITDGRISNIHGTSSSNGGGYGYIQSNSNKDIECVRVDLQGTYNVDEIIVWHHYYDRFAYYNNITYTSSNGSTWREVINEASTEKSYGKKVSAYTGVINGYVQNGLVAWYDGKAYTGNDKTTPTATWKNLAGLSYDGTITSGTWGDNYLQFNGTSTWVNLGEINNDTFTIEALFSATNSSTGSYQYLVTNVQTGGTGLSLHTDGRFQSMVYGTSKAGYSYATSPTSLTAQNNTMYSSSQTYDGTVQKLFVNGSRVTLTNLTDTVKPPNDSTVMAIGANPTGTSVSGEYFKGKMYSVRIYNRALTEEEIYHNYLYDKARFGL